MARVEIETALDNGRLFVRCVNGKAYQARRNGQTQTWKRDVNRYRIPIKWAFRQCGQITETSAHSEELEIR